jgi:hypothetical protein
VGRKIAVQMTITTLTAVKKSACTMLADVTPVFSARASTSQ